MGRWKKMETHVLFRVWWRRWPDHLRWMQLEFPLGMRNASVECSARWWLVLSLLPTHETKSSITFITDMYREEKLQSNGEIKCWWPQVGFKRIFWKNDFGSTSTQTSLARPIIITVQRIFAAPLVISSWNRISKCTLKKSVSSVNRSSHEILVTQSRSHKST
jgi:hypothetical protein